MTPKKLALWIIALVVFTTPALAQGGGGGGAGGAGGGSAGAASSGASSGAGGPVGPASSGTGGTADMNNRAATPSTFNTDKIVADEKAAATQGTRTVPMSGGTGTVSAPNVGVGHAANGLPTPGSGLGSPENSAGPTK